MHKIKCEFCINEYYTKNGLQKHIKKYHNNEINNEKNIYCIFCNVQFTHRQSKWRHEKKCKLVNNLPLEEQIKKISEEIKEIKANPNTINNTTNNTTNIQYIINSPTSNGKF
jgi:hypothetical protein